MELILEEVPAFARSPIPAVLMTALLAAFIATPAVAEVIELYSCPPCLDAYAENEASTYPACTCHCEAGFIEVREEEDPQVSCELEFGDGDLCVSVPELCSSQLPPFPCNIFDCTNNSDDPPKSPCEVCHEGSRACVDRASVKKRECMKAARNYTERKCVWDNQMGDGSAWFDYDDFFILDPGSEDERRDGRRDLYTFDLLGSICRNSWMGDSGGAHISGTVGVSLGIFSAEVSTEMANHNYQSLSDMCGAGFAEERSKCDKTNFCKEECQYRPIAFPPPSTPTEIVVKRPRYDEYLVDYCKSWGTGCGQVAADYYCKHRYGQDAFAAAFTKLNDVGASHPTLPLGKVPRSDHAVWGVGFDNGVYRLNGTAWEKLPGVMRQLSVGADGEVWAIDGSTTAPANGYPIYRWNGMAWKLQTGSLSQISVGSASAIWGVNNKSMVYQWTGSGWTLIPGTLRQVSAAADGSVWGVDTAGNIVMYGVGYGWLGIAPGTFAEVSAGSRNNVWAVTTTGEIYRIFYRSRGSVSFTSEQLLDGRRELLDGDLSDMFVAQRVGGTLKHISAGADGSVWGVHLPSGRAYRWTGDGWERMAESGTLKDVSHDFFMIYPPLCTSATCDAFETITCQVAALDEKFDRPRIDFERLAWCANTGNLNCGRPAAQLYCEEVAGAGATAVGWKKDADIGAEGSTMSISDGAFCEGATCDGFRSITCQSTVPLDALSDLDGDYDKDGVRNFLDNCSNVQNGPVAGPNDQLDSDWYGEGDECD